MSQNELLEVFLPMLWSGFLVMIKIAVAGVILGLAIGILAAAAKSSGSRILHIITGIYTNIFRSIPLLVQALYFYYVVPKLLGVEWESVTVGVIVLGLNSGAFFAEIIRGAFQAVDPGIKEAGTALGLSQAQIFFHLTFPMAIRQVIPSLCNQFIISIKDTSLLTIISINEMTQMTKNYVAMSFHTIEGYTVLALAYLAVLSALTVLQKILSRKFSARAGAQAA